MTYLDLEYSGGSPVELYKFVRTGASWLYTSGDEPVTYQGEDYSPAVISRGDITASDEGNSGSVEVSLDSNLSIVPQFIEGTVPSPLWLTIFRFHRGDLETVVIFQGQVSSSAVRGKETTIQCTPTRYAAEKLCPRILYQKQCNHMLYDRGCKVNKDDYKFSGEILGINGPVLQIENAFGFLYDKWLAGGFIQIPGTEIRVFITDHDNELGEVTVLKLVPELTVGLIVDLYAGCDRTELTCHNKFANMDNFLGFPDIPNINPFRQVI